MKIGKNHKLLFIGDSITDCGRSRPVGNARGGVGNGYVALVDAFLSALYPEMGVRVVNMGIGGDQVRHIKARWENDFIAQKPEWLAMMIGTNDVWRQFDYANCPEFHVLPAEYEETLGWLVADALPRVKGLVLMTPFFIEPCRQDAMRARIDEYCAIAKKVAAAHPGVVLVDTQAAFDKALRHASSYVFSGDRVHPNAVGNMIIAKAFLDAIDFKW